MLSLYRFNFFDCSVYSWHHLYSSQLLASGMGRLLGGRVRFDWWLVFNIDRDCLHLEDRFGNLCAVGGVQMICQTLEGTLKVGSVVMASVVKHESLGQLFVASRIFCGGETWGTCAPRCIIPAAGPVAIRAASVLLASVPPISELCGVLFFLEFVLRCVTWNRRRILRWQGSSR
jgi:hypothetical protein